MMNEINDYLKTNNYGPRPGFIVNRGSGMSWPQYWMEVARKEREKLSDMLSHDAFGTVRKNMRRKRFYSSYDYEGDSDLIEPNYPELYPIFKNRVAQVRSIFYRFPSEMLLYIAQFCETQDQIALALTCKDLYHKLRDPEKWLEIKQVGDDSIPYPHMSKRELDAELDEIEFEFSDY